MIRYFFREWKAHPLGIILLILGYTIGTITVTFGISFIEQSRNSSLESTSGNPKHIEIINLRSNKDTLPTYSNLFTLLSNKSFLDAEIQVGIDYGKLENKVSSSVIGIYFNNTPEWIPSLLSGRFFTVKETQSKSHLLVIGKNIAERLFPTGINTNSSLNINDEPYNVIGVIGKESKATQWDQSIYIPFNALPEKISKISQSYYTINIFKNGSSPHSISEDIKNKLLQINPNYIIDINMLSPISNTNNELWNSIIWTTILSGLILFVSSVNIINLSIFWILDRKREIGIRKSIGATDGIIMRMVISDILSIVIFSSLIAISLQIIIMHFLSHYNYFNELQVTWYNVIVSILVAIIIGLITSIQPVRVALNLEPIEVIKS